VSKQIGGTESKKVGSRTFPMPPEKMQSQWPKTFEDGINKQGNGD